jgi:hypothetical protein
VGRGECVTHPVAYGLASGGAALLRGGRLLDPAKGLTFRLGWEPPSPRGLVSLCTERSTGNRSGADTADKIPRATAPNDSQAAGRTNVTPGSASRPAMT